MSNPRRQKALKVSLLVGLIAAAPVVWVYFLQRAQTSIDKQQAVINEFVFRDDSGKYWSRATLAKGVSIMAVLPENLPVAAREQAQHTLQEISTWVEEELRLKGGTEFNPLYLFLFDEQAERSPERWQSVSGKENMRAMQQMHIAPPHDGAYMLVIDDHLRLRSVAELDERFPRDDWQRLVSKLITNQYLNNYLARRTFMGQKRQF